MLSDPGVVNSAFDAVDVVDEHSAIALYAAIARQIVPHFQALNLVEQSTTTDTNTIPQTSTSASASASIPTTQQQINPRLKPRETTLYIGHLVLQALRNEHPDMESEANKEEILRRWESVIPAAWIGECDFDSLLSGTRGDGDRGGDGGRVEVGVGKSKGRKGKWHERFRGQRDGEGGGSGKR